MDSQEALDAPRFCLPAGTANGLVCLEADIPSHVVEELKRRGHKVYMCFFGELPFLSYSMYMCFVK